ncbi:MAG TPA: PadR family transcriptional regulator [Actinomycetota bacterium]|nr:PadR family transcriptional regulator [Actinomycetota bacterium]
MLELAVLGLLKERPMHGYQLSRELSDAHGPFWRVSYGSLYPTLRRLEREGAIEATADAEPEPTRSGKARTKGRRKTVYRITEPGERLFLDLLEEAPHEGQSEDARFRVRLAFFRYLPPETRIRLMERRRAALEQRLAAMDDAIRTGDTDDAYQRAVLEHSRATTGSDIAWLTGLIQAERDHGSMGSPRYRGSERRATATLRRKERTT